MNPGFIYGFCSLSPHGFLSHLSPGLFFPPEHDYLVLPFCSSAKLAFLCKRIGGGSPCMCKHTRSKNRSQLPFHTGAFVAPCKQLPGNVLSTYTGPPLTIRERAIANTPAWNNQIRMSYTTHCWANATLIHPPAAPFGLKTTTMEKPHSIHPLAWSPRPGLQLLLIYNIRW